MADAVFISWSGNRGNLLAALLYNMIRSTLREHSVEAEVKFSPVSHEIGNAWREQLEEELATSKFGILLLDPGALRSFWVAFETGFLAANRARLFPLVLSESLSPVRGTPFESLQCAVFSVKGFEQLLNSLSGALGDFLETNAVTLLAQSMHAQAAVVWEEIQSNERGSGVQMLKEIKKIVEDYTEFGLVEDDVANQVIDLLSCSRRRVPEQETSLLEELSAIARLFQECGSPANGDFGDMATAWALKNLIIDAHQRLREVTHGKLSVRNRAPVREFWLNSVFGRARSTVWTTNVAKPGANMGGALDRNLLGAQGRAVERGVRITRLFVYDPEMSIEEAELRRSLIRRQIDLSIDVRVITRAEFRIKAVAENATRRIGSDDFMVIDDQYLYLTFPDENNDIEAILLNGRSHSREIEAARAFKEVLEAWADKITHDNLERFPSLLIG